MIFFVASFTAALQRAYLRVWRRPPGGRAGARWRGVTWLLAMLAQLAVLGALRGALDGPLGIGLFAILTLAAVTALWWFTAWFFLLGDVRARALLPTGLITGITLALYAASARAWMPNVVTDNEEQFGIFGVALALVTWFSGAAICILLGACAGVVFAEDTGAVGALVRGGDGPILAADARPSLPPPVRELHASRRVPKHERLMTVDPTVGRRFPCPTST